MSDENLENNSWSKRLKKAGKSLIRILMLFIIVFTMISGCIFSRPGPLCIESDDLGDRLNTDATVPSKPDSKNTHDGWIDTGLIFESAQPFSVRASGQIDLCHNANARSFQAHANYYGWEDTGIAVSPIDSVTMSVSGDYKLYAAATGNDVRNGGKGLFIKINDYTPPITPLPDRDYPPTGVNLLPRDNTQCNENYFEAIPCGSGSATTTFNGAPRMTGNIYAMHADSITRPDYYVDNVGGYTITVTKTCLGFNGMFLAASIGDDPPELATSTNTLVYLGSDINRTNGILYSGNAPTSGGKLWLKILDEPATRWTYRASNTASPITISQGDGVYANNDGNYNVTITTRSLGHSTAPILSNLITPLRELLFGSDPEHFSEAYVPYIFSFFVEDPLFKGAINAALILAVTLYAASYLAGMGGNSNDFIIFLLRIGLINVLLTNTAAWEFFYSHLFKIFLEGMEYLILITTNQIQMMLENQHNPPAIPKGSSPTDVFGFLSETLNRILTLETNIKILSLTFLGPGPVGITYMGAIYAAIFTFFYAIANAFLLYAAALIGLGLLFMFAPLFIVFLLFSRTRGFFTAWMKYLFLFMLQPVLLFMVIGVFNVLVYSSLVQLLSFSVCWKCAAEISIPIGGPVGDLNFCLFHAYAPWGYDSGLDATTKILKSPFNILSLLSFCVVTQLMYKMTEWVEAISIGLSGAGQVSGPGGIRNAVRDSALNMAQEGIKGGLNTVEGGVKALGKGWEAAKNAASRKPKSDRKNPSDGAKS